MQTNMNDMAEMLAGHGDRFTGNHVADESQDWLDNDFSVVDADKWCKIGVWDAATAARFRDARKTPEEILAAADLLVVENGADEYTDGDPIYSACNRDTDCRKIIALA